LTVLGSASPVNLGTLSESEHAIKLALRDILTTKETTTRNGLDGVDERGTIGSQRELKTAHVILYAGCVVVTKGIDGLINERTPTEAHIRSKRGHIVDEGLDTGLKIAKIIGEGIGEILNQEDIERKRLRRTNFDGGSGRVTRAKNYSEKLGLDVGRLTVGTKETNFRVDLRFSFVEPDVLALGTTSRTKGITRNTSAIGRLGRSAPTATFLTHATTTVGDDLTTVDIATTAHVVTITVWFSWRAATTGRLDVDGVTAIVWALTSAI